MSIAKMHDDGKTTLERAIEKAETGADMVYLVLRFKDCFDALMARSGDFINCEDGYAIESVRKFMDRLIKYHAWQAVIEQNKDKGCESE